MKAFNGNSFSVYKDFSCDPTNKAKTNLIFTNYSMKRI
jgi:hypothetical protein